MKDNDAKLLEEAYKQINEEDGVQKELDMNLTSISTGAYEKAWDDIIYAVSTAAQKNPVVRKLWEEISTAIQYSESDILNNLNVVNDPEVSGEVEYPAG